MKSLFVVKVLIFKRSAADKIKEPESETNEPIEFRNLDGKRIQNLFKPNEKNHLDHIRNSKVQEDKSFSVPNLTG